MTGSAGSTPRRSTRSRATRGSSDLLAEPGRVVFARDGMVAIETPAGRIRSVQAPGVDDEDLWKATSDHAARRIAAGFDRESSGADHFESTVVVWDAHRPADTVVRVDKDGTAAHAGIDDFVLSPDGDRLYVVGRDADAWLRAYDTSTGGLLASVSTTQTRATPARGVVPLQAGDRARSLLRISDDGRTLATNDGADVVLVDPRTMSIATRLRGHTQRVVAAEFSGDARLVAASAIDGSTLVWDRETGAIVERLEGIRTPVEASPSRRTPRRCTDHRGQRAGVGPRR